MDVYDQLVKAMDAALTASIDATASPEEALTMFEKMVRQSLNEAVRCHLRRVIAARLARNAGAGPAGEFLDWLNTLSLPEPGSHLEDS